MKPLYTTWNVVNVKLSNASLIASSSVLPMPATNSVILLCKGSSRTVNSTSVTKPRFSWCFDPNTEACKRVALSPTPTPPASTTTSLCPWASNHLTRNSFIRGSSAAGVFSGFVSVASLGGASLRQPAVRASAIIMTHRAMCCSLADQRCNLLPHAKPRQYSGPRDFPEDLLACLQVPKRSLPDHHGASIERTTRAGVVRAAARITQRETTMSTAQKTTNK